MTKTNFELLNEAFYKFKAQTKVTDEFMELPHDASWAKRFRELSNLSMREMARLTGYTKSGVQKAELGYSGNRYFECVQALWDARSLDSLPDGFQDEAHAPKGNIPLSLIATHTGEWRRCLVCNELKYFTNRNQVYCSNKCRNLARFKLGIRVKEYASQKRPKALICPHCGTYIPGYRKYLVRDYTDKTYRQAPPDTFRHMEGQAGSSEVSYLLRRLETFIQAEADAEVPAGGESPNRSDIFKRMLETYYNASQGEAGRRQHHEGGEGRSD